MRRSPRAAIGVVAAAAVALSGCSPAPDTGSGSAVPASPSVTSAAPGAPGPAAPGGVGVSAGGVTTAVSAPAESTEDDYFQACRAAKTWIGQQGGDPHTHIEPYLGMLQRDQSASSATFGKPWTQLTPGQQSGVIVAVQAAADSLCG